MLFDEPTSALGLEMVGGTVSEFAALLQKLNNSRSG